VQLAGACPVPSSLPQSGQGLVVFSLMSPFFQHYAVRTDCVVSILSSKLSNSYALCFDQEGSKNFGYYLSFCSCLSMGHL
jgi:hypothetical protein